MTREEVLEGWLSQYGDLIKRTCCLQLGDESLAEDAAQETFISAWRHMAQFEGRNNASPKTWLVSIAINTCRNYRRSAYFRRTDRSLTPENVQPAAHDGDRTLWLTVQSLPSKYRETVILTYYHGMDIRTMAQTLHVARSTAHHRLQKALKMLKIELTTERRGEINDAARS